MRIKATIQTIQILNSHSSNVLCKYFISFLSFLKLIWFIFWPLYCCCCSFCRSSYYRTIDRTIKYEMCTTTSSPQPFQLCQHCGKKARFSSPRSSCGILWRHSCLLKRLICTRRTGVGKLFRVVEASDESRRDMALCLQTFWRCCHGRPLWVSCCYITTAAEKKGEKNQFARNKKINEAENPHRAGLWFHRAERVWLPHIKARGEQTSPSLSSCTQCSLYVLHYGYCSFFFILCFICSTAKFYPLTSWQHCRLLSTG